MRPKHFLRALKLSRPESPCENIIESLFPKYLEVVDASKELFTLQHSFCSMWSIRLIKGYLKAIWGDLLFYMYLLKFRSAPGKNMAAKEKLEAVLNVALRVPSIMLLDVLYRWDVSSFFQQIQRSSLNNNPLFQYKYLALNMHYVGKCLHPVSWAFSEYSDLCLCILFNLGKIMSFYIEVTVIQSLINVYESCL